MRPSVPKAQRQPTATQASEHTCQTRVGVVPRMRLAAWRGEVGMAAWASFRASRAAASRFSRLAPLFSAFSFCAATGSCSGLALQVPYQSHADLVFCRSPGIVQTSAVPRYDPKYTDSRICWSLTLQSS